MLLSGLVARVHLLSLGNGLPASLPKSRLALEAVTAMLIGATAHLGGYLSGVNL